MREKQIGKYVFGFLYFLIGAGMLAVEILYRVWILPSGRTWLFPWTELFLAGGVLAGLCSGILCVSSGKKRFWKKAAIGLLWLSWATAAVGIGGGYRGLWLKDISSRDGSLLVLEEKPKKGVLQVDWVCGRIFRQKEKELSWNPDGGYRVQWPNAEVCVIYYQNREKRMRQYTVDLEKEDGGR